MSKKRDIVCPCGNYLGNTTNINSAGTKVCNSCKRTVKYTATKDGIYTSYQK